MFNHPFLKQLDDLYQVPLRYENEETRAIAQSLVPIDIIEERADSQDPPKELRREVILLELMRWFKFEFFKWLNTPVCDYCRGNTTYRENGIPSSEERLSLANRVEVFWCENCCKETRFPRYNCPRKLLETRKGRCGEWANCFTLICLTMGYDARYIYDVTDHVWTEVWSESQKRWLHCDSCENSCDKPLVYQKGWRKTLSYVFAFSKYEVVDVTWRYVTDYDLTLAIRRVVPEKLLIQYQEARNRGYQSSLDCWAKYDLAERRVRELTEFLVPPKVRKADELNGRTSGDLLWRMGRDEVHSTCVIANLFEDIKVLKLEYSCAKDCYTQEENGKLVKTVNGWRKMVFSEMNVFRKEEYDWEMAYISRCPGTDIGRFQYRIEVTKPFRRFRVKFHRHCYENGEVIVTVFTDDKPIQLHKNDVMSMMVGGSKKLIIECELRGGKGDVAWQHAQAFRQPLKDTQPAMFVELFF